MTGRGSSHGADAARSGRWATAAAVLVAVLAALLWIGPSLWRADLFEDDAAHHVFWLYQYADATLFPGDLSVHYLRTSAPLGYQLLYGALAPLVDALTATEWLSVLLLWCSCWLAWQLVRSVDGPEPEVRGLFAVVAVVYLIAYGQSTGGILPPMAFQRTFALPVTLLCLWGLLSGRYGLVGLSWLGAALFYPVMLPVLGLTGGAVFAHELFKSRRMPRAWLLNGVLGAVSLLLALFGMPRADDLGPATTYEQAMAMPEFGTGGRLVLYAPGIIDNLLRFHMTGIGWSPYVLALIVAGVAFAFLGGVRKAVPAAAWAMLGVGMALWLAMRLFPEELMFGLYLPNRHSRWAVAAFGVVALSAGGYGLISWLRRRMSAGNDFPVAIAVSIVMPAIVFLFLAPRAFGQLSNPVDSDLERTYAFIRQLPRDTLVAAHPDLANFIPLRTQHSVLTSTEVSMPWLLGYYAQMKPRLEASLRAAYATEIGQMDREMSAYGVDVFVTGPAAWKREGYLRPLDGLVRDLRRKGDADGYVLKQPPSDRILFRSGDYYVVKVEGP